MEKKVKSLNIALIVHSTCPYILFKTRRVTKGRGELRKGLLMPSGRDDKRKHE